MQQAERDLINRLKRIEGQVRALQQMIEDRRGCEAILTQLISVRAALDGTATKIVTIYVDECLAKPPDEAKRDLVRAVELLGRVG